MGKIDVGEVRAHLLLHQRMKWLGSIMVHKRTNQLGNLKALRVFCAATMPLCQNLRGKQLALLTRHRGNTMVLNKAILLGDR